MRRELTTGWTTILSGAAVWAVVCGTVAPAAHAASSLGTCCKVMTGVRAGDATRATPDMCREQGGAVVSEDFCSQQLCCKTPAGPRLMPYVDCTFQQLTFAAACEAPKPASPVAIPPVTITPPMATPTPRFISVNAGKVTKRALLSHFRARAAEMGNTASWSVAEEELLETILTHHFEEGGRPFDFSESELKSVREMGVPFEALFRALTGERPSLEEQIETPFRATQLLQHSRTTLLVSNEDVRIPDVFFTLRTVLTGIGSDALGVGLGVGGHLAHGVYLAGDITGSTSTDSGDSQVEFIVRFGVMVPLDSEGTSFFDLRAGLGGALDAEGANDTQFVFGLGPGLIVAFGAESGGFFRAGFDLELRSPLERQGPSGYPSSAEELDVRGNPTMAFGFHF